MIGTRLYLENQHKRRIKVAGPTPLYSAVSLFVNLAF
jgi:hypothetical protein